MVTEVKSHTLNKGETELQEVTCKLEDLLIRMNISPESFIRATTEPLFPEPSFIVSFLGADKLLFPC